MQNKINELMSLSNENIQKRLLASLIALIEDEKVYDDVKKEAIKVLPNINLTFNSSTESSCESNDYCSCKDDCSEISPRRVPCKDLDCSDSKCILPKPDFCTCKEDCNNCEHNTNNCYGLDCECYINPDSEL